MSALGWMLFEPLLLLLGRLLELQHSLPETSLEWIAHLNEYCYRIHCLAFTIWTLCTIWETHGDFLVYAGASRQPGIRSKGNFGFTFPGS